ncbi:MAG TPA: apolipoprotein N-acyltransferase [Flavobacteriales bacterium]|nr:apolipoprotein N-acyltransferase [Flavobacteriales bacterium]
MPTRSRVLLWSALSGVLWALAWPAIGGFTWIAFVAWLPMLHAERLHDQRTTDRKRSFYPYLLLGLFLWNALTTYWFYLVSEPMTTKLVSVGVPVIGNTLLMGIPWWLRRMVKRRLGARWADAALVATWLAYERVHHGWDLQWPWLSIGNVFGTQPTWVQWYELTGMLGGSLWVWIVTLLLNAAIGSMGTARAFRFASMAAGSIFIPLAISHGLMTTVISEKDGSVEVVVVQPNVDPYKEKFGGIDPLEQLERMLAQAEERITGDTRLVVFPETALQENATMHFTDTGIDFNGLWENNLEAARSVRRMRAFQQAHPNVALLCGMSSDRWFDAQDERPVTARPIRGSNHWYEAYNAALWLPAQGPAKSYHKSKLVAGVELMPFEEVLGSLSELALDLGGTTGSLGQQEERSVLRDASTGLNIVPAICYESVFGEHIAAHVRNGGELIAVMTNDGWWSDSPGYKQHLAFSSLRAIETRRMVVRSANTGISCIVDQRGIISHETDWWVHASFAARVHPDSRLTFFVRHGDLIGRAAIWCSALLLIATLLAAIRNRSVQRHPLE